MLRNLVSRGARQEFRMVTSYQEAGDGLTQPSVLGSVVIPAHNEAAVIARCLDALLDGFEPGELEVAVACNGCTDGTADIARSLGYKIDVLEIETASKPAALRVADEALTVFPRIYLDADIVLTSTAARKVLDCLRAEVAPVARPPISYDTQRSSLPVRSYCRARSLVPAVMHSVWGAGVYGLSVAGRARFGAFPDLIADDLFVDQHFRPDEIKVVDATPVVVRAPVRTRDLIRIRAAPTTVMLRTGSWPSVPRAKRRPRHPPFVTWSGSR